MERSQTDNLPPRRQSEATIQPAIAEFASTVLVSPASMYISDLALRRIGVHIGTFDCGNIHVYSGRWMVLCCAVVA